MGVSSLSSSSSRRRPSICHLKYYLTVIFAANSTPLFSTTYFIAGILLEQSCVASLLPLDLTFLLLDLGSSNNGIFIFKSTPDVLLRQYLTRHCCIDPQFLHPEAEPYAIGLESAISSNSTVLSPSAQVQHLSITTKILTPNFPHDTAARKPMPVRLERGVYLSNDQKTILCSIAAANLTFQKSVICQFTLDYWKIRSEVAAEYRNSRITTYPLTSSWILGRSTHPRTPLNGLRRGNCRNGNSNVPRPKLTPVTCDESSNDSEPNMTNLFANTLASLP
ncbi:hypothetical protein BKA56DRAFT_625964 [Ilyonectria sp. MPI-CAGE-AT-0026]|nr:hypothetical protein BKA56DRAFT_625964 [Ilyonectria sp. MPI-CAGE-AT-0026]